ncbi:hypothetical protein L6R29_21070 [Myxococcota bacterium]|nr:hypothetical protein [Myxococcota bacterium]
MNEKPHPPEELETALANVRMIREVMDKVRLSHPVREMMRPLLLLGLWFMPVFVLYGVVCQWLLDQPVAQLWGQPKSTWIWSASFLLFSFAGYAKYYVSRPEMNRHGYDYLSFLKRILVGDGYLRIVFGVLALLGASIALVVQAGLSHQIPGLFVIGTGAIMLMLPLALPLPELTGTGVFLIFAGIFSLFVFPTYPFYKISVLFGLFNLLVGLQGLKIAASPQPITLTESSEKNAQGDIEKTGQTHG